MAPSENRQTSAEITILDKLAKRPILLIVLTASICFGVQQIPLSMITSTLKVLRDASTYQTLKLLDLKESLPQLVESPLILAFVCCAILFILYTSQQGKRNLYKTEDEAYSLSEPRRGLLSRTATLGQSIFSQLIPNIDEARLFLAKQASGSSDHLAADQDGSLVSNKQEDVKSKASTPSYRYAETATATNTTKENDLKSSVGRVSGSETKLSRPNTSTGFSYNTEMISIGDPKLRYFPKSFRDDLSKHHKEELNRPNIEAYSGNVRRQLLLRKQESLLAKQLDLELKEVKRDWKQTNKATPMVASGLGKHQEVEQNFKTSPTSINKDDLIEDQIRKGRDAFFGARFDRGSGPRGQETKSVHQRKRHSKSYSLGSSAEEPAESAPKNAPAPELLHSTSNQLIRADSLAIDNQKFESFLKKFRNELKLQKQESNLRKQLLQNEF